MMLKVFAALILLLLGSNVMAENNTDATVNTGTIFIRKYVGVGEQSLEFSGKELVEKGLAFKVCDVILVKGKIAEQIILFPQSGSDIMSLKIDAPYLILLKNEGREDRTLGSARDIEPSTSIIGLPKSLQLHYRVGC